MAERHLVEPVVFLPFFDSPNLNQAQSRKILRGLPMIEASDTP